MWLLSKLQIWATEEVTIPMARTFHEKCSVISSPKEKSWQKWSIRYLISNTMQKQRWMAQSRHVHASHFHTKCKNCFRWVESFKWSLEFIWRTDCCNCPPLCYESKVTSSALGTQHETHEHMVISWGQCIQKLSSTFHHGTSACCASSDPQSYVPKIDHINHCLAFLA